MSKTKVVSGLTIALSLLITLSKFDLGVKFNLLVTILIIFIPLVIHYITEGLNDKFVDELANAIMLLKENKILGSSDKKTEMSIDDIKRAIKK